LTVSLVGENIEHARIRIAMIEDITERKRLDGRRGHPSGG